MDPITPGVISGLVTNALGGAAGSIPRILRSRRNREVRNAVGDLNASAQSFLLPALASLADRKDGAQETVGRFLGTVEAESYVRSVACAALSGRLNDLRTELRDQLVALLVLVTDARQDTAHELAGLLLGLFTKTIDAASKQLEQADQALFVSVGDRARAEKQAGSLDGLVRRNKLLQRRKPSELADFLDFADQYRTLQHDRTSELVPAYFDVQRRVPIDRLYVKPQFSHEQKTESLDALLTHAFRMVILGAPGAGKSTLAQYLAHIYSAPRTATGDEFGVVPFVVTLRRYEEWKKSQHGSVVGFIAAYVLEDFQLTAPAGAIEYLLLTGRAFVLFDGLDELINIATRREICDVIANFADLYTSATVLVTSRTIGYFEAPINATRFGTTSLLDFTYNDIETYVTNWFAVEKTLNERTHQTIVSSFLEESASAWDIRTNPLMLGLMCNLYRRVRMIPQNRSDLYEKCAMMLFEEWDTSRGIKLNPKLKVLKAEARSALQDVALWMYTTPELSGGVTEKQLVHRLADFWGKRFEDQQRAMDKAKELLALWKGRTWVLSDVGSSGREPKLVYKFTHQTFLEFFAAVELVRRNTSPEALWHQLREPVSEGTWEIVAQLAIQKLHEGRFDGADEVLNLLVADAAGGDISARTNLLSFASRNLDNLYALVATKRRLIAAAMDLALATLPSTGASTSSRAYFDLVEERLVAESPDRVPTIDQRDLWQPILTLLERPDERDELVIDELLRHSCDLISHGSPETTASAFVFLMMRESLELLAHLTHDSLREGRAVHIPAQLWNSQELKRRIGQALSPDHIVQWGRTNFWAPVLACREHLITVAELVRSAGVAMLTCCADPFLRLGVALIGTSPLEELLLAYLNCVHPHDQCRFSNQEARRTLMVVGRELDRDIPRFDTEWLSKTALYERIVRRKFVFGDGGSPAPTPTWMDALPDQDAAFGGAVLLALVIEAENWDASTYSDELFSLTFGPLQVLEPVFVARGTAELSDTKIDDALTRSGLSAPRRKVLADWANRRINFTLR